MALKHCTLLVMLLVASGNAQEPDKSPPKYTIFVPGDGNNFDSYSDDNVYEVYRNIDEFVRNWPRNDSCNESCARAVVESIDFTKDMLVVIAPRDRGQDTYDVVIFDVVMVKSYVAVTFIELRYGESQGTLLCGIVTVAPQPSVALLVPQNPNPVRFFRKRADVLCEETVEVKP